MTTENSATDADKIARLCRSFLDEGFDRYDARAFVTRILKLAQSRQASAQGGERVDRDALHIKVMYLDDETPPFIFWCHGRVGGGVLGEIEADIAERPADILDKGFGDYEFTVTRDPGQYGEAGMCEISPYWDFTDISFKPHIEGAPAWVATPPATSGMKEAPAIDKNHLPDLRYIRQFLLGLADEKHRSGALAAAITGINYIITRSEGAPQDGLVGDAERAPPMYLDDDVTSNPEWLFFKHGVLNPASDLLNAIAAEREACAVICDENAAQYARQARGGDNSGASDHREDAARECASEIRAGRKG